MVYFSHIPISSLSKSSEYSELLCLAERAVIAFISSSCNKIIKINFHPKNGGLIFKINSLNK